MTTHASPMPSPQITHAILEEYGTRQMDPEMGELEIGLQHRGVPVEFVPIKRILRRQIQLSHSTLVAGSIPFVRSALLQLGLQLPTFQEYPVCLADLLHRRMWSSTLRQFSERLSASPGTSCFAKPATRRKRFSGRVFKCPTDLAHTDGASGSTVLLCAEVVEWVTEHRAFVLNGHIIGIRHYRGDPDLQPNPDVVNNAIATLQRVAPPAVGYAADFGLLTTGETALVELNDAWGLGSWGLDVDAYTDLILARWREIIATGGR